MLGVHSSESSFCNFQAARTSLPSKIIRLRKISQENHVSRMKMAHKMKEMKAAPDTSSFLSPSISKINSNCCRTPFTLPRDVKHSRLLEFSKENWASARVSYNHSSPRIKDIQRGSNDTEVKENEPVKLSPKSDATYTIKITQHEMISHKTSSDVEIKIPKSPKESLPETKERLHPTFKKKSSIPNSVLKKPVVGRNVATSESTLDDPTTSAKLTPNVPNGSNLKIMAKQKENRLKSLDSSGEIKSACTYPIVKKSGYHVLEQNRCLSASKIPIAVSRLSQKEKRRNSAQVLDEVHTCKESDDSEPVICSINDKCLEETLSTPKNIQKNEGGEAEDGKMSSILTPEINDDLPAKDLPERTGDEVLFTNDKNLSPNKMSSVTTWLISNAINDEASNDSDRPRDEISQVSSRSESQPAAAHDLALLRGERDSDTDESVEYYDIEESGSAFFGFDSQYGKEKEWSSGLDKDVDDDSTVTVPSDKDLDLQTHRETDFQDLPDYPNTPYNLRYPRYNIKDDDSVLRSDGKEMADALKRLRIAKNRKTAYSTPRRKKSKTKMNLKYNN